MAFQTSTNNVIAQINMTPMIDLLLVMLIIFLVIAPVHSKGLKSEVPQPAPSATPAKPEPDVVLAVARDGSLQVNTKPVSRAELGSVLSEIFRTRQDRVIFVSGSGELLFGQVADVIDVARGAGADRVALITGA